MSVSPKMEEQWEKLNWKEKQTYVSSKFHQFTQKQEKLLGVKYSEDDSRFKNADLSIMLARLNQIQVLLDTWGEWPEYKGKLPIITWREDSSLRKLKNY
jgi:hypothetical protein